MARRASPVVEGGLGAATLSDQINRVNLAASKRGKRGNLSPSHACKAHTVTAYARLSAALGRTMAPHLESCIRQHAYVAPPVPAAGSKAMHQDNCRSAARRGIPHTVAAPLPAVCAPRLGCCTQAVRVVEAVQSIACNACVQSEGGNSSMAWHGIWQTRPTWCSGGSASRSHRRCRSRLCCPPHRPPAQRNGRPPGSGLVPAGAPQRCWEGCQW